MTGAIGGRSRWRTMPWVVIVFGLAVGPLGAISIALVIIQPVVYGEFCTLCLASAVVSLAMIGPALDEFLASPPVPAPGPRRWRVGLADVLDGRPPARGGVLMERGVLAMLAATAVGVWLYAAPGVLGYEGGQAIGDRVAGALIIRSPSLRSGSSCAACASCCARSPAGCCSPW